MNVEQLENQINVCLEQRNEYLRDTDYATDVFGERLLDVAAHTGYESLVEPLARVVLNALNTPFTAVYAEDVTALTAKHVELVLDAIAYGDLAFTVEATDSYHMQRCEWFSVHTPQGEWATESVGVEASAALEALDSDQLDALCRQFDLKREGAHWYVMATQPLAYNVVLDTEQLNALLDNDEQLRDVKRQILTLADA